MLRGRSVLRPGKQHHTAGRTDPALLLDRPDLRFEARSALITPTTRRRRADWLGDLLYVPEALYCIGLTVVMLGGPGPWSLDARIVALLAG